MNKLVCLIALVSINVATEAAVLYSDNFETPVPGPLPSNSVTNWLDTSKDANPIGPVGQNWVVQEDNIYNLQVARLTQNLSGSPWGGNSGPTWAPSATGGLQYLEMYTGPNGISQAWAPLSAVNQAVIATNGILHLGVEVFGLSGHDGWHSNLRIAGFNSAATAGTNPAFDVQLVEGGSFLDGSVKYVDGTGTHTIAGLTNKVNQWQTLAIDADFNTDTFSLNLDGNTVAGLTWAGGDLSTIQSVVLEVISPTYPDNSFYRGGFDNFELSSVPEPSVMALLGLSGLVLWRRRGIR
jgi:hypothetical protein